MAARSPIDLDKLASVIERSLAGEARVAAALLFGSTASGRAGATSDIDLAVLFAPSPRPAERYAVTRSVLTALAGHLDTGRIDLVILNDAPPALAFQVLRHGRVALQRDPVALHRFRVLTYRLHGDFQRAEELFRAATRARALAGGRHG